jgi:hypothetical protein
VKKKGGKIDTPKKRREEKKSKYVDAILASSWNDICGLCQCMCGVGKKVHERALQVTNRYS